MDIFRPRKKSKKQQKKAPPKMIRPETMRLNEAKFDFDAEILKQLEAVNSYALGQVGVMTLSGIHGNWQSFSTLTTDGTLYTDLLQQSQNNGGNNVPAKKFNDGDTVIVVDANNKHVGQNGTVHGYDIYNGVYHVLFVTPPQGNYAGQTNVLVFKANQLEAFDPSTIPRENIVDFDSVVMEEKKKRQILEALEQVNQSDLIFKTWGFAKTMEKGKGVSMLFFGPPGTGKTLMGQAIADKLNYDLRIVGVAEIETAEPGGAERNIKAIFDKATGKTILFFDECDSLIFDRSQAGMILGATINQLLTSLERFEGITIFTTNRLETLDEAVNRRLALKLEFSMPTAEQRVDIWKRMFPAEAPLDKDIEWEKLASVEMAGGYIKNAVLRAARIAATAKLEDSKKKIKMEHLVRALQEEGVSMYNFQKAKEKFNRPTMVGNSHRDIAHTGGSLQIQRSMDILKDTLGGNETDNDD